MLRRLGAGGARLVTAVRDSFEHRLAHLRATRVLHAQKKDARHYNCPASAICRRRIQRLTRLIPSTRMMSTRAAPHAWACSDL